VAQPIQTQDQYLHGNREYSPFYMVLDPIIDNGQGTHVKVTGTIFGPLKGDALVSVFGIHQRANDDGTFSIDVPRSHFDDDSPVKVIAKVEGNGLKGVEITGYGTYQITGGTNNKGIPLPRTASNNTNDEDDKCEVSGMRCWILGVILGCVFLMLCCLCLLLFTWCRTKKQDQVEPLVKPRLMQDVEEEKSKNPLAGLHGYDEVSDPSDSNSEVSTYEEQPLEHVADAAEAVTHAATQLLSNNEESSARATASVADAFRQLQKAYTATTGDAVIEVSEVPLNAAPIHKKHRTLRGARTEEVQSVMARDDESTVNN